MTLFLAMSSAVNSQLHVATPETQATPIANPPLCTRPKETHLKELVEAKFVDKYPMWLDNAL